MTYSIKEDTKEYYGKVLKKSTDLKTNACCTSVKYPKHIKEALSDIHDDVLSTYYGCGLVVPDCLTGCKTLDLGCGTGRDVYLLSKLVGENGNITGVDMTPEQIEIAAKYVDYHTEKYRYKHSNVGLVQDYIESLSTLKDDSYDVIVSNCVVNLSNDKKAVFRRAYDLLKDGGEMYFSDVYSDRRIPDDLRQDKVLWGECLSGALYVNDFLSMVKKCGFIDPRKVSINRITVKNKELEAKLGEIKFYSITYRLFKLPNKLDDNCEDYGQGVLYKGTIEHNENVWHLDDHHKFEKSKYVPVCRNTYNMLKDTRFNKHFEFSEGYFGNGTTHYGIFSGCGSGELDGISDGCC